MVRGHERTAAFEPTFQVLAMPLQMHVPGNEAIVNYKNILVALDFSPAAETVGKHARAMAEQYQANLTILHVFEYIPPITLADDPFPPLHDERIIDGSGGAYAVVRAGRDVWQRRE